MNGMRGVRGVWWVEVVRAGGGGAKGWAGVGLVRWSFVVL